MALFEFILSLISVLIGWAIGVAVGTAIWTLLVAIVGFWILPLFDFPALSWLQCAGVAFIICLAILIFKENK